MRGEWRENSERHPRRKWKKRRKDGKRKERNETGKKRGRENVEKAKSISGSNGEGGKGKEKIIRRDIKGIAYKALRGVQKF